jgi:hypothetical protein
MHFLFLIKLHDLIDFEVAYFIGEPYSSFVLIKYLHFLSFVKIYEIQIFTAKIKI